MRLGELIKDSILGGGEVAEDTFLLALYNFLPAPQSQRSNPGGGRRGCSSKFSKATPKSYHIGCGSSQFYSQKVTLEIFIHRNSTRMLKIIAKGQQVLLYINGY